MTLRAVCVIIGGGLGAYLRYLVHTWIQTKAGPAFPFGTLAVNVSGAFLIGLLMTAFANHETGSSWKLFLIVGVLGGYTTFSALAWETYKLFSLGDSLHASMYILASGLCGALALIAGVFIGRLI
jgi:CrcB protein